MVVGQGAHSDMSGGLPIGKEHTVFESWGHEDQCRPPLVPGFLILVPFPGHPSNLPTVNQASSKIDAPSPLLCAEMGL